MKQKRYIATTPFSTALSTWLAALGGRGLLTPGPPEHIAVVQSRGRITAEAVFAQLSSPFYHAAAMDGYAVRFPETFGASETNPRSLRLNAEARYVDTGDPLPEGFNAVVMVEDVSLRGDTIEVIAPLSPWDNVRVVGEDMVASELILPQGHMIRPVDMGAMLAGGLTHVAVRRQPRVAVIPTGSEIVPPGSALKPGDIIEFTSTVLGGLVEEWGGCFIRQPIVADDPDKIKQALLDAVSVADVVVINAGASTGSEDYTSRIISENGELLLHGIAMRPGKPAMLGFAGNTPVLGLPGYPVAGYTVMRLFGRPLVRGMLGFHDEPVRTVAATLSRQISSALGSDEFVRVKLGRVSGKLIATPLGRGAGLMMSLVRADALLHIPADSEGPGAATEVELELLGDLSEVDNTVVSIGSHDTCMDLLGSALRRRYPHLRLSSAHVGSMGGLMALRKGEAHIAPTHLLDEETGEYNRPWTDRLLADRDITLINLVQRTQGFMIPKGNPKNIRDIHDLTRDDVIFINRQRGAGTRLLLDKSLREANINPADVIGYERDEYTHMAVASAVLSGVADTGLGVLSAARALGLDFIPLVNERYDLAIPTELLETPAIAALLDVIRNDGEFRAAVLALGGYDVSAMGMEQ